MLPVVRRLEELASFTEAGRYFFEQVKAQAVQDERVRETARANPLDKFSLGIRDQISDLMIARMGQNDALVKRYLEEPEFQNEAYEVLAREIFAEVRSGEVGVAGG